MLFQNQKVADSQKDHDYFSKKRLFELEKEFKDTSKFRYDIEADLKAGEHELGKED